MGIEVGRDRSLHLFMSVVALRAMCGVCAGPFTDAVRALLDAVYEAPPGFEAFQNLCALHLAVQKMGQWVLGRTVTFGDVCRRAVFVGPSETRLFSRNEARAGCAALASIRVVHAPGDVEQLDPVFVNPKGVADVATRLLSNVEQLLVLRRFADREVKASLMAEEVQAVSKKLDAWLTRWSYSLLLGSTLTIFEASSLSPRWLCVAVVGWRSSLARCWSQWPFVGVCRIKRERRNHFLN